VHAILKDVSLKANQIDPALVQVKPDNLENLRSVFHPHKFCKQWNEHDSATSQELLSWFI
jgi:hypothetical protein